MTEILRDQATRFAGDLARLAGATGPVLLAVSGGPDSMAMLTLAAVACRDRVTVATVDHRLRAGAVAEAAMVARHCATLGLAHATLAPAVPPTGASVQAQARDTRYGLLAGHAAATGATIATAHHIDDQAETFLMRAARGSGVAGLAGVRPIVTIAGAVVVRPLLDWRRAELRAIVRRQEVPFVDDPANTDPRHDRTRFRILLHDHEWLDAPALARAAGAVAEADADLAAIADWLWTTRARTTATEVTLDMADVPRALARRLAHRAMATVREAAGIVRPAWTPATAIEPLLDALARGGRATQAGVVASGRGAAWRFRPAPPRRDRADPA